MTVYDQINGKSFAQLKAVARPVGISVIDDLLLLTMVASVRSAITSVKSTLANSASTPAQLRAAADAAIKVSTSQSHEKACLVSAHDAGYAAWFVTQTADSTNHAAAKALLNTTVSFGVVAVQISGNAVTTTKTNALINGVDAIV